MAGSVALFHKIQTYPCGFGAQRGAVGDVGRNRTQSGAGRSQKPISAS